ncbi:hypothetical protein G7K_0830-t1 [Saitoella complicata NRRL Y-17804]|uniref:EF-hand domain-containing protein n=1 Tax=Saitoella complicata (strain BCRC 22490 / CBS 7301 / JCM 7358 / NBRC 10748 / NRRL Y-17804) TaxID=698492 RepID=A0A0E9N9Y2_SAICN|nr:hypothetical protein G7K_0830-t1 [Saitoella complicata NRRL Y-17804]
MPSELTPRRLPQTAMRPGNRNHLRRATSGAFHRLSPTQAQELKESFNLLDKDGDGVVEMEDLRAMLVSLGQNPNEPQLKDMLDEMPSPLNFAAYLTFMSSHLLEISSRDDLLAAFSTFDESNTPALTAPVTLLMEALVEEGMGRDEVERGMKGFVEKRGVGGDAFSYVHDEDKIDHAFK